MTLRRVLTVLVIVVVVLVAAVAGGLFLYSEYLFRDSYGSDYNYEVRISPSAPISNVTVLVPLPTLENGESPVTIEDVRHPFTPANWTYDVVDTEYGPMLRIRADEIPTDPTYHYSVVENDRLVEWKTISADAYDPTNESHLRVEHDDVDISTMVESSETIDTKGALETEPLLRPHEERDFGQCYGAGTGSTACYDYIGRAMVAFDGANDTVVHVSAELYGSNSWWVFGWNYNEYQDRQAVDVVGPQDDWVTTEGHIETGRGNYRDPPR